MDNLIVAVVGGGFVAVPNILLFVYFYGKRSGQIDALLSDVQLIKQRLFGVGLEGD